MFHRHRSLFSPAVLAALLVLLASLPAAASDVTTALKKMPLFSGLTQHQLQEVTRLTNERTVHKGETLIARGQTVDRLFLILSGSTKIQLEDGSIPVRPDFGRALGEIELVSGGPAEARVGMLEDGHLVEIPFTSLRHLMDVEPQIGYRIMENIARQIAFYLTNTR